MMSGKIVGGSDERKIEQRRNLPWSLWSRKLFFVATGENQQTRAKRNKIKNKNKSSTSRPRQLTHRRTHRCISKKRIIKSRDHLSIAHFLEDIKSNQ